ncbi:SIMPL domain-containing protein [Kitasatospora sp. NPDC047058]|uniref:SIMPL domain-containing protein n=1 Tax=Kitasatospora sp. NPDC047058 TaxID=3155620 RepID=UPI0033D1721A
MDSTQFIAEPWGISVFGAADVSATPDLARITVRIRETRPKPAEAFEVTRAAAGRVRDALRRHGVADAGVSTSRLGLESEWDYSGREQRFIGYRCTAAFGIELRELDLLEQVLVDVVEAGANHVDGVEFDVGAKRQLRGEARRAAVAAAREKAELYAEAAGVRLGAVVHIQDVDAEQLSTNYRSHGRGSGSGEGDLTPGAIRVSAGVLLGLALISG